MKMKKNPTVNLKIKLLYIPNLLLVYEFIIRLSQNVENLRAILYLLNLNENSLDVFSEGYRRYLALGLTSLVVGLLVSVFLFFIKATKLIIA